MRTRTKTPQLGMTMLEIMIVLAIMAGASLLVRSGFRMISKDDIVENSTELTAVLQRTSQLAIENASLYRVLFDLDKGVYVVEECEGELAVQRNEQLQPDPELKKEMIERGKQRMLNLPANAFAAGDPDEATRRAGALAGAHVQDRSCRPAKAGIVGDASGKGWQRMLRANKVKFKLIAVAHRDDPVTKGQVALYFFPMGGAEKAVIELTDGDETFSVLVWGLTGKVELHDGETKNLDDHMMKNIMGDKNAKREDQQ
jgi:prepilin-type N-terminal cleavage/methylation domain-containing protein